MITADRLRKLADDWDRYDSDISEEQWRMDMLRAVAMEMQVEVRKLAESCGLVDRRVRERRGHRRVKDWLDKLRDDRRIT